LERSASARLALHGNALQLQGKRTACPGLPRMSYFVSRCSVCGGSLFRNPVSYLPLQPVILQRL
jgi:hypothetical protein